MSQLVTTELREAIRLQGRQPLRIVDDETQQVYYLLSADVYRIVESLLSDTEFDPREAYPLIAKTAGEAGWNDPIMDEYDDYYARRNQP